MVNKEIKVLTAEEAREITKSNRATFDMCMRNIESQTKFGTSVVFMLQEIDSKAKVKLMDLGYTLGAKKDMIGAIQYTINWKE